MLDDVLPTQAEIYKLERELQDKKRKIAEARRKEEMKKEEEFKKSTKVDVGGSDDYYYATSGEYNFYYGYEETMCKKHPKNKHCEDDGCEERERCFVVSKRKEEIMKIPTSGLKKGNIEETFISGIMMFIQEITTKTP